MNKPSAGRRRNFSVYRVTVLEAKDGVDALAVAKNHGTRIDLVVTDVVMPNMSGGQLAVELSNLRPETRLLFVSGYAGKTVLDHKVFDLETNFLQKPYTLKQLSGKIRGALNHEETGTEPSKSKEMTLVSR
jgi:two-component system cell cycle sensor histidine kinase/response regulator CckA